MKRASWRTTTAYHLRALWRQILVAWYELLDRAETWWRRWIAAVDPYDRARDHGTVVVLWQGEWAANLPGGARADVWVRDLGDGWEDEMVTHYLLELDRAERGVRQ